MARALCSLSILVTTALLSASCQASPIHTTGPKTQGTPCPPGHVSDCRYIVMMHPSYSSLLVPSLDSIDPIATIASTDDQPFQFKTNSATAQQQHPSWVNLLHGPDTSYSSSSTSSSSSSSLSSSLPTAISPNITSVSVGNLTWYSATMSPETAAHIEQQQDVHQIKYLIPDLPVTMYGSGNSQYSSSPSSAYDGHKKKRVQKNPPSWGLDRIDQRSEELDGSYHYPSSSGQNVTIYVIDTGVNTEHKDFEGRAVHGPIFLPGETDHSDKNGHGTFVAALVGGATYGVAKKSNIVSLKALDDAGAGRLSNVLAAIEWVVNRQLALGPTTKSIINLSLGAEHNDPTNEAILEAMRLGVHFAIAAGNDGKDACQFSPASTPGAMTVGATDQDDAVASYSNFGPCVAIYAPGSDIVSAWTTTTTSGDLNDAKHTQSGTSMASPHVAGLMAMIMSEEPERIISTREMNQRILNDMTKFSLNGHLVADVTWSSTSKSMDSLVTPPPGSLGSTLGYLKPSSSENKNHRSGGSGQGELEKNISVEPTPEESRRVGGLQRIRNFNGKALARNLVFVGSLTSNATEEFEGEHVAVTNGAPWTVGRGGGPLIKSLVAVLSSGALWSLMLAL